MNLIARMSGCAAALLVLSAIFPASLQGQSGAPVLQPNPADAINQPHKHAWDLFLAVNHPADLSHGRGIADPTKKIGDAGQVVWETWKLARTEVFLDPATKPETWETPPSNTAKIVDPPKSSVLVAELLKGKNGIGIQLDPGEPTNETRMNKATFDFMRDNGLYSVEGQEEFMQAKLAAAQKMSFPLESVEVKASWRKFAVAEEKPEISGRYYTHRDENGVLGVSPRCIFLLKRFQTGSGPRSDKLTGQRQHFHNLILLVDRLLSMERFGRTMNSAVSKRISSIQWDAQISFLIR
ncbi:hypothetical protein [Mesorhizobium sp. M0965]|uniref:hypothetical protein n=1 Tax=Mesorhizobium sp. M0965 TaxID=2957036 RepID=UPI003335DED7